MAINKARIRPVSLTRVLLAVLTLTLLLSQMVTAIPANALSQPTVTVTDYTISTVTTYAILFTLDKELGNNATITITFPSDTTINATSTEGPFTGGAATIKATTGWISGVPDQPAVLTSTNWTARYDLEAGIRTISYTLTTGDKIGEGAEVRISITAGITNPTTAGSYTLTVGTYIGTTAIEAPITSAPYTIVVPTIIPPEGIASVYNTAGVLMNQFTGDGAITNAIAAVTANGWTIKISPGIYNAETPNTNHDSMTFVATGTTASTRVIGDWTIDQAGIVINGLSLEGTLTVSGDRVTIKNSVLSKQDSTTAETMVVYNNTTEGASTIENCTFDISYGTIVDTAIDINNRGLTVSTCSFTLDAGDTAIDAGADATIKDCPSITGGSATGVVVSGASSNVNISGCTFDSLENALVVAGGTGVTLRTSTIKKSTKDAIKVTANVATTITGNTISDTAAGVYPNYRYAVNVAAAASGNVSMLYNNFTGNAYNVKGEGQFTSVDATHNWWGAATGPAAGTIVGGSVVGSFPATGIDCRYYLGAPVITSAAVSLNSASLVLGKLYANVDVTATGYTPAKIGAATYSANATTVEPPYTALADGYYDVYVSGGSPSSTNTILIKFYNAKVTAYTKVYVWSTLQGKWVKCVATISYALANPVFLPQGVNPVAGYAYVNVVGTGTVPAIADLAGTPFVLVEEKAVPAAPTLSSPALGAYDISVEPMFVWSKVPGAIRYQFALSKDPTFATLKWSADLNTTMFDSPETLRYSTTYYWRVRALTAEPYLVGPTWVTSATDWATGIFTTEAKPVEPTVAEVPAPKVDVTVEPAEVTAEPSPPVISEYVLWVIIGIGAVLVIAVIVLIVRTRRA